MGIAKPSQNLALHFVTFSGRARQMVGMPAGKLRSFANEERFWLPFLGKDQGLSVCRPQTAFIMVRLRMHGVRMGTPSMTAEMCFVSEILQPYDMRTGKQICV